MSAPDDAPRHGRILTFYSYKGGTGRSMALANVAWILASAGKRVLVVDWDFEAPGLHRYLHPFLDDPELASTRGLIDYFIDVSAAARAAVHASPANNDEAPWWSSWCSFARYTVPVNWKFEGGGVLDFVPAGHQCPSYGMRVSSMNWAEFYEKMGGGVLLEALKKELRDDYDYVLLDSRTGLSDTAGICTVQMPDELVVFFTLNSQSIKGAAAVAESAWTQRLKASGAPGLKVWPVPTRVEVAEKDRLDAARSRAHATFLRFIELSREDRQRYWERIEVPYQPYYAYEEVLAPFAEGTSSSSSMLRPMEALSRYVTGGAVTTFKKLHESERLTTLARFVTPPKAEAKAASKQRKRHVYISYAHADQKDVHRLIANLNELGVDTWSDRNLLLGDEWEKAMLNALLAASLVLVVIPQTPIGDKQAEELNHAIRSDKRIVPILIDMPFERLPPALASRTALRIGRETWGKDVEMLANQLKVVLAFSGAERPPVDSNDPQKGQWGGLSRHNGRELTAAVSSVGEDWFRIQLQVRGLAGEPPLTGIVKFHLHPTFPRSVMSATAIDGVASIKLTAWGAFTVGAVVESDGTQLELDLAALKSLPKEFRER